MQFEVKIHHWKEVHKISLSGHELYQLKYIKKACTILWTRLRNLHFCMTSGAYNGAVGWGTALQARRSWVFRWDP